MVTGGARSGKSSFAQSLLKDEEDVLYIATAIAFDDEMKDRVKKHRESRPKAWETLECYSDVAAHIREKGRKHIFLDCMTIMVTNLMFHYETGWDNIGQERIDEIEKNIGSQVEAIISCVRDMDVNITIVTNEIGMGIVPEGRLSRIFRDIAGRINQMIAREADEVYMVVSGIPVKIKQVMG